MDCFSPYPPYTAIWYNTHVSCSQIAMSPQNVLSVRSVCSASVVILGIKYKTGYHTALNMQKPTSHDKLLMAPQIKHNWESIHPAPQYRVQTSSQQFGTTRMFPVPK
jgi:hypothetical protein